MLTVIYLMAIILANLSSFYFGPKASIINAFLLIGLDLSCRDKLHEKWHGKNLILKMSFLIIAGSAITFIINRGAYQIALASTLAFGGAIIVDSLIYHILYERHKLIKMNGSNIFSSIADSIIFPTVAFGMWMPMIIVGQSIAKICGGALWSFILTQRNQPETGTARVAEVLDIESSKSVQGHRNNE